MKEMTYRELRENLADVLNRIKYLDETFVVTRHGKPEAQIGPIKETPMALVDQIEMLGIGVDGGLIDRDAAAELLAKLSKGGLTKVGAEDAIAKHRGMRQTYEGVFDQTRKLKDALESDPGSA